MVDPWNALEEVGLHERAWRRADSPSVREQGQDIERGAPRALPVSINEGLTAKGLRASNITSGLIAPALADVEA